MAEVKPRLAVGYQTIRQSELDQMMLEEVRKVYDGPLVIADDLMAWNVSKDAKRSGQASYSEYINAGKWKGYVPPPLPEQ